MNRGDERDGIGVAKKRPRARVGKWKGKAIGRQMQEPSWKTGPRCRAARSLVGWCRPRKGDCSKRGEGLGEHHKWQGEFFDAVETVG